MVDMIDKWEDENIGEVFVNKATGAKAKFMSRSDGPSVTLGLPNGEIAGFGIGSLNDKDWVLYKDNWNFVEELKKHLREDRYVNYDKIIELFKWHNQKVKEDINKIIHYSGGEDVIINANELKAMIDKRGGNL